VSGTPNTFVRMTGVVLLVAKMSTATGGDAPAWITAVATAILALGVVFAWGALEDARRTRHAHLVAEFSLRWDSADIVKSTQLGNEFSSAALEELAAKIGPKGKRPQDPDSEEFKKFQANVADWDSVAQWPNLLETIGVMVSVGALPADMVYRVWAAPSSLLGLTGSVPSDATRKTTRTQRSSVGSSGSPRRCEGSANRRVPMTPSHEPQLCVTR
jgi:hypothetical protein